MAPSLLDLPTELVIRILSFLHVSDLTSCLRVNKFLSRLVRDSVLLQYIIETHVAGVENNPNSKHSLSERLRMLRSREKAWGTFQSDFTKRIYVSHKPSDINYLTGGVFLLGDSGRSSRSVTTALHYVTLPTLSSHRTGWSRIDIHRNIVDIGLAIHDHDLIAIVTSIWDGTTTKIEVVLLSFSTGNPHPAAQHSTISVNKSTTTLRPSIRIEIAGDHLVLVAMYPVGAVHTPDRVYVFDWKKGIMKLKHYASRSSYSTVVFLSIDIFLLPNANDHTLEFWCIPTSGKDNQVKKVHTLSLPQVYPGQRVRMIACRGEPNPRGGYSNLHSTQAPFFYSPADSIINFTLHLERGIFDNSFTIITHRRALLSTLTAATVYSTSDDVAITPWAEWGPPITRWFTTDVIPIRWITTPAGQRCVIISEDAPIRRSPVIVLDFNPYHVRLQQSRPEPSGTSWTVTNASSFPHEGIFNEPVNSFLPYAARRSSEKFGFHGVLMDEERVVGICTGDEDTIVSVDVLHFG